MADLPLSPLHRAPSWCSNSYGKFGAARALEAGARAFRRCFGKVGNPDAPHPTPGWGSMHPVLGHPLAPLMRAGSRAGSSGSRVSGSTPPIASRTNSATPAFESARCDGLLKGELTSSISQCEQQSAPSAAGGRPAWQGIRANGAKWIAICRGAREGAAGAAGAAQWKSRRRIKYSPTLEAR